MNSETSGIFQTQQTQFAPITRRIQAVIIDSVILLLLFFGVALFVSNTDLNSFVKIGIVAVPVLGLEPCFVSFTGASIGHHFQGLWIERKGSRKRLNFFLAMIRFLVKNLLGWLSFIFILTTQKHQALHDIAADSVVVMKDSAIAKGYIGVSPRIIEDASYIYPSKVRRILVAIPYALIGFIICSIFAAFYLSDSCIDYDQCSREENAVTSILGLVWVATSIAAFVSGWYGYLWGARRKKV